MQTMQTWTIIIHALILVLMNAIVLATPFPDWELPIINISAKSSVLLIATIIFAATIIIPIEGMSWKIKVTILLSSAICITSGAIYFYHQFRNT